MQTQTLENDKSLLDASSRIALAAFLHDLGKFAQRAGIPVDKEALEICKQLDCPRPEGAGGANSVAHVHAAYTTVAMEAIENHLPNMADHDAFPFAAWKGQDTDDSLINAASRHHKPDTFLQWVVAMADRMASGFGKEEFEQYNRAMEDTNLHTARQLTLLEQINIKDSVTGVDKADLKYRYALKPLSPDTLFPVLAKGYEDGSKQQAEREYRALWDEFVQSMDKIPASHQGNLSLWLDHFETLWGAYTQAIPAATVGNTRPDVSLYDHSRTTAALATALWRYHHETETTEASLNDEWNQNKFLLIQGDFFGIQSFIFASGGESTKRAAKLLRGRSFYVSMLSELASLKVLDALELPATSQIINAAGKFLIVAPNTPKTIEKLQQVQVALDQWFLDKSWGQSGIGLAWQSASAMDFVGSPAKGKSGFKQLIKQLFEKLEEAKHQRLNLCSGKSPAIFDDYLDSFDNNKGVCQIDGRSPGRHKLEGDKYIGDLAKDQMDCGDYLVKYDRLLISTEDLNHHTLGLPIFGYYISFTKLEDNNGNFDDLAAKGGLLRLWDYSLPQSANGVLWNGYARRNINAYVSRFDASSQQEAQRGRYKTLEHPDLGDIKTLNHLALDDRQPADNGNWMGETALMTLKGDIDNLGLMFQRGLGDPSFAKMASLSRQINSFFAIYLPWLCQSEPRFHNTYTVFAGGDDFFLIGPWRSTLELARVMRLKFVDYVANNSQVHFSVGLSMTKPGLPITWLAENAEQMLDRAKEYNPKTLETPPKNAVCCFNETMFWDEYDQLSSRSDRLDELKDTLDLSTGYVYGLLKLVDMREKVAEKPENAIWNSYFAYRTRRMLERSRGLNEDERQRRQTELAKDIAIEGIEKHGSRYRVALFTHLYKHRH